MDSRSFLGLEATHNRFRWKLPVTPGISTSGGFLFGGSGLAAAISAMEGTSERRCIWATAQYLSYAEPGEVVDVDVTIAVEGHQVTQARAVCHVADREILTVNAALGDRPFEPPGAVGVDLPRRSCRRHESCEPRRARRHADWEGTISERLEERLGEGSVATTSSTARAG